MTGCNNCEYLTNYEQERNHVKVVPFRNKKWICSRHNPINKLIFGQIWLPDYHSVFDYGVNKGKIKCTIKTSWIKYLHILFNKPQNSFTDCSITWQVWKKYKVNNTIYMTLL